MIQRTNQQNEIFEKFTKPLAGRTLLWTPFLRIKSEAARKNRKWEPEIGWVHWHPDWHLIGIRIRFWGGEYEINWISDPGYFLNKKSSRLL